MLSHRSIKVFAIIGPKETIPHEKVTSTDWFRILCIEESRQPDLLESRPKVLHELVRGKTDTFPIVTARLVRVCHAQKVNGTHPWITERENPFG